MKKTFEFEAEEFHCVFRFACPRCNGTVKLLMKQTAPETRKPYHYECKKCHLESEDAETENGALREWIELINNYTGGEWHGEA